MVYFIKEKDSSEFIKIGFTDRTVDDRVKELQTGNPRELELEALIEEGDLQTENRIHNRFSDLRKIGEWFHFREPLVAFVNDVKAGTKGKVKRKKKVVIDRELPELPPCMGTEEQEEAQVINGLDSEIGEFLRR